MEPKTTNKKPLGIAIAALCILLALAAGLYYFTRPQGEQGVKKITVVLDNGTDGAKQIKIKTEKETLLDAMIEKGLIKQEDYTPKYMIETIDGRTADKGKQEFWSLSQNGEFLNTGFDQTMITDGAQYEVTLTTW